MKTVEKFYLKNFNVISNFYVFNKFNLSNYYLLKTILLQYTKNKIVEVKVDFVFKKMFFRKEMLILKIDFYDSLEHKDIIRNIEKDISFVFDITIVKNDNIESAINLKNSFS